MQLIIGGCRGTHPVAQPGFTRYGGETTSFLVVGGDDTRVIVDAGTGVRTLGAELQRTAATARLLLLFSHYHLDHTMGLPALGLLYDKRWTVTMAAPRLNGHVVSEVLPRLLHAPFWPLQVEDLASTVHFRSLPDSSDARPLQVGSLRVRWCPLQHPGGCSAYRIDENRHAVVIATDVEWAHASAAKRKAFMDLCQQPTPASLLVMDGQYDTRTYAAHAGWGHSTWQECVAVARAAGVGRLLITHHAPAADDRALRVLARRVRRSWPRAALARAGQRIAL